MNFESILMHGLLPGQSTQYYGSVTLKRRLNKRVPGYARLPWG